MYKKIQRPQKNVFQKNFLSDLVIKLLVLLGGGVSKGYWALSRFELLACYHQNCQTPDQTKIKIRSNQKSGEAL